MSKINQKSKLTLRILHEYQTRLQPLIEEYDELFHEVGKLTDVQVKLHINPAVKAEVQPTRRVKKGNQS